MNRRHFCGLLLLSSALPALAQGPAPLAIRGETVYTMAGAPIRDGVVLVRDGKIERVGPASEVRVPDGYRTLTAKIVTPGLIDARTVVGLAGYTNQAQEQDQLESSAPIQPELRAIDAYNSRETLVGWLRGFGVTTLHTGPAPGALMPGQTMVVKTVEVAADRAVLKPSGMIAVTLGTGGLEAGRSPGTRSKAAAMLRAELLKAKDYAEKQAAAEEGRKPPRDLRLEALAGALTGETPLLVTAHRSHDILTALRIAEEFGLKIVLDGASEAYLVLDQLKAAGMPVILHAPMARPDGDAENASFETAAALRKAGIPFALQSGYEGYVPKTRVVLFEAALAAANGLSPEDALASITSAPARILGISDRVGSLEAGKDADLALFDGDPFEYTTHVTTVVIDGQVVSTERR
ncbi:MAG: amidohydrolase family protein [Armatimonadota bacterium]